MGRDLIVPSSNTIELHDYRSNLNQSDFTVIGSTRFIYLFRVLSLYHAYIKLLIGRM